jgi:broad specificity phosphatase PhoE
MAWRHKVNTNSAERDLMPLQLYLVRHGETEWALCGRHTGRTDISLTTRGEDEARQLGSRLRDISFSHVLTSPRKRASRTCELVGLDKAVEVDPDLAEWAYGDYEGLRSAEIRKGRADWNLFRDGCPHGETPAQVADRADRLITRLRMLEGNVALFSHGQFGAVLAARWIGLAVADAQHFPLGTASLSVFGYDPHHLDVPVIALWNAASHDTCDMTVKQRAIERWENEGGQIPRPARDTRVST